MAPHRTIVRRDEATHQGCCYTQQQPTTTQASASMAGTRPIAVLFKFATSEDRQAAL